MKKLLNCFKSQLSIIYIIGSYYTVNRSIKYNKMSSILGNDDIFHFHGFIHMLQFNNDKGYY